MITEPNAIANNIRRIVAIRGETPFLFAKNITEKDKYGFIYFLFESACCINPNKDTSTLAYHQKTSDSWKNGILTRTKKRNFSLLAAQFSQNRQQF